MADEYVDLKDFEQRLMAELTSYEDVVIEAGNPDEVEKSWLQHDLKNSQEVQRELRRQIYVKLAQLGWDQQTVDAFRQALESKSAV
jgi:hypothetical protein